MKTVILYSKVACQPCKATKRHLDKIGVEYQEINLDTNPDKIEYMKRKGHKQAPFVEVYLNNELHTEWSGFSPDHLAQLNK